MSGKPKRIEPFFVWCFGIVGGLLLQHSIWVYSVTKDPSVKSTSILSAFGFIIAICFCLLGLLLAIRVMHFHYPSSTTEKVVKSTLSIFENPYFPLKSKKKEIVNAE